MGNKTSHIDNTKESQINDTTFKRCLTKKADSSEIFILIWLDKSSKDDSLDSLRTKNLLCQMDNNNCLFYDDLDIFLTEYKELKFRKEKILLIVSGSFAQEILSQIKDISTIIIFCNDYNKYYPLFKQSSNVRDICTEHESLKNSIQHEVPSLKFNLFHNQTLRTIRPLPSSSLSQNSINTGAYFSYISFIDILKQMPKTDQAKEIMISKCLDYYRHDESMLREIKRFHNTYKPENAIEWYTEDSFVYRLVNQAFRTEDISLWYLFRFYTTDLSAQLKQIHTEQKISTSLTLYRGQSQLPIVEFEYMKANIDGLIATNGFFSTSTDENIAKTFILDAKDDENFKVVLFVISVDLSHLKNSIFVDLKRCIKNSREDEVLFDIGSVFKIENVEFDQDLHFWRIKMKATDEGTEEMEKQLESIRKKFQTGNINMLFGRLLIDMGHYSKAESYFQLLLQVLPKDHKDLILVYNHIGDLHMRTTNWNEAFKNFNQAYELGKNMFVDSNHYYIAISLNNIANYYSAIDDFNKALCFYEKTLKCKIDQLNRSIVSLNIGSIYNKKGNYCEALKLCIEARDQLQEIQPNLHIEIINCYTIIGDIYSNQGKFEKAEGFYSAAFAISQRYLVNGDDLQINCIKVLVELYQKQGKKQRASDFYCEQFTEYSKHLSENHISIAHLLIIKCKLYDEDNNEQIHCYKIALNILEKNSHLQYGPTADCLMLMGKHYERAKMYGQAVSYYKRAYEIQKKIYPTDHVTLLKTHELIISVDNMY